MKTLSCLGLCWVRNRAEPPGDAGWMFPQRFLTCRWHLAEEEEEENTDEANCSRLLGELRLPPPTLDLVQQGRAQAGGVTSARGPGKTSRGARTSMQSKRHFRSVRAACPDPPASRHVHEGSRSGPVQTRAAPTAWERAAPAARGVLLSAGVLARWLDNAVAAVSAVIGRVVYPSDGPENTPEVTAGCERKGFPNWARATVGLVCPAFVLLKELTSTQATEGTTPWQAGPCAPQGPIYGRETF